MTRILDTIDGPADVKKLSPPELFALAAEIREELVATVGRNGGHLASNLGVVELSLALHRVFNSPCDKIVWDVGHQSYVHKLLTGRRERFATLRQYGGLAGFCERAESPHDPFGTGHASTSISAALGLAAARDLAGEDFQVVAVIGDGALTGGMAFEGLNQAGHLGTRMIVVLNDNAMAIAPSVGAISRSLGRLRLDPRYRRAKEEAGHVLERLPLGGLAWQGARRLRSGLKGLLMPTLLWEELGFKYIGPVDGHDLAQLEEALSRARDYPNGPIFIHVLTRKGKGYPPAEEDAVAFHGLSPRDAVVSQAPSYGQVFGRTLSRLFREDPRLLAITAAMPSGTSLDALAGEFPGRVFDVGISEQHAVTFAAGLAAQGFIPIVAIYSTFLQRAFDQIVHDVCLQGLPVVFAVDRAGIVGEDGKTHQGTLDLSFLSCIPRLAVCAPKDENELQHLLYTAVQAGGPVAIRYPRGHGVGVPLDSELHRVPLGQGELLRPGRNVGLLAIGSAVAPALGAAEALAAGGVECAVANLRFAKPLDAPLILEVARATGRLVTVEENTLVGGVGSAVASLLQEVGLRQVPVERIGVPDEFVEHGPQELLRARLGLDAQGITRRVLATYPELGAGRLTEVER